MVSEHFSPLSDNLPKHEKSDRSLGPTWTPWNLLLRRECWVTCYLFLDNASHPLHGYLTSQQRTFSSRLIQPCCSKEQVQEVLHTCCHQFLQLIHQMLSIIIGTQTRLPADYCSPTTPTHLCTQHIFYLPQTDYAFFYVLFLLYLYTRSGMRKYNCS